MQDRVSLYPGRVKMVPVAGQENTYDMVRADSPTQEGTPLNKDSLLKDATAALLGGDSSMVPDEAFMALKRIGDDLKEAAVQVASGTYTGTGGSGSANKSSLTFEFVPLVVSIVTQGSYYADLLYVGQSGSISTINSNSIAFEQVGTSLFWWARAADAQMNESGVTYVYRAIGLKEGQV